jgi:hypothetical protein
MPCRPDGQNGTRRGAQVRAGCLFVDEIMADPQRVIDESRPMLEEFLVNIAVHPVGRPLDFRQLLDPFSKWLDAQKVSEDDRSYLASRLSAFICEYLIESCSAERVIENNRIVVRLPIREGVLREFATSKPRLGHFEKRRQAAALQRPTGARSILGRVGAIGINDILRRVGVPAAFFSRPGSGAQLPVRSQAGFCR